VSAEVARAAIELPGAAARAARTGSHAALATFRAAGVAVRGIGQARRVAVPVVRDLWERLPEGSVQIAAAFVVVAAIFAYFDVAGLTQRAFSAVGGMFSSGSSSRGSDLGSDSGSDRGSDQGSDSGSDSGSDQGSDHRAQNFVPVRLRAAQFLRPSI
jgi:hypothetical protein